MVLLIILSTRENRCEHHVSRRTRPSFRMFTHPATHGGLPLADLFLGCPFARHGRTQGMNLRLTFGPCLFPAAVLLHGSDIGLGRPDVCDEPGTPLVELVLERLVVLFWNWTHWVYRRMECKPSTVQNLADAAAVVFATAPLVVWPIAFVEFVITNAVTRTMVCKRLMEFFFDLFFRLSTKGHGPQICAHGDWKWIYRWKCALLVCLLRDLTVVVRRTMIILWKF